MIAAVPASRNRRRGMAAHGSRMTTPRPRRGPRPVTAQSLENAALHYLERFSSSAANLRLVLMRRVTRAAAAGLTAADEGERLVAALIQRYLAAGLLDDSAYAAQQAASLARRGASRRAIRAKLAVKGLARDMIDAAVAGLERNDLAAACTLVRRRRLGPYRPAATRAALHQRDLAALARAGFASAIAHQVLAAADPEALEALAAGDAGTGGAR
jgi:regulatory protein